MTRLLAALISSATLAGCAAKGEFPSLAPRPYEQGRPASSAPATAVPDVSDAARVARINAAVQRAEAGREAFNAALSAARSAVSASQGGYASEGWIAAQMAVSRAERTREPVQAALAELDAELRSVLTGPPTSDRAILESAIARVMALDTEQGSALAALGRALSR
jgi:hypothetical protein